MYHKGEGQKGTTGSITNSHQNYVLGNQDASCPNFADMKNTGIKLALWWSYRYLSVLHDHWYNHGEVRRVQQSAAGHRRTAEQSNTGIAMNLLYM